MAARFQNLGILADGGMAEICLGRDTQTGAHVALKRIKRPLDRDPSYLAMFEDEGRLWQRLRHPNIVRLICAGVDDEGPFIAMELVEGLDLGAVLSAHRDRPLPVGFALTIGAALCDALEHIHGVRDEDGAALGLVHRDVSPGNVLCGCDGEVKLTDFGVVQAAIKTHQTRVGDLKGKFAYMSPEQTRGEALSPASDLFAVGVVLWELLADRPLFDRATDVDTAQAVRDARVPPLSEQRDDIPPELEQLLQLLLAQDAQQRPHSADKVARQLRSIGRDHGILVNPQAIADVVLPLAEAQGQAVDRALPCARRRTLVAPQPEADAGRSWLLRIAVAAVILAGAVGTYALLDLGPSQPLLALGDAATSVVAQDPRSSRDGGVRAAVSQPALSATDGAVVAQLADAAHAARDRQRTRVRNASDRRKPPRERPPTQTAQGSAGEPAEPEQTGYGTLDLNAEPWAQIAVDGVPLGRNTPLRGFTILAGRHRVTLHNPVFKITRTVVIDVKPGEHVRKVVDLSSQRSVQSANR